MLLLAACGAAQVAPPSHQPAPPAPAPAPAPAPKPGLSRKPTGQEAALIDRLARDTERLRGLRFRAPVEVRIQDRTAMRAYVESALDEAELERTRRRYLALGLLDPALDVRELIVGLMEEELVGYYDPEQKQLAVRNDVADALAHQAAPQGDLEWRATVVHELVHALQDQHLGLSTTMKAPRTTDAENAFGALIEGDATLVMLGYVAEGQGATLAALVSDTAALARSLHDSPLAAGGRLARAPALVREPLLFRYREGAVYVARLFARGGWDAVNQAHHRLPASTFLVREGGARTYALAPPEFQPTGAACRSVDRDVLGALEVSAALAHPGLSGAELARGWRGDAYRVLDCGGEDASLWFLRFSSAALAKRVRAALKDGEPGLQRKIAQHGASLMVSRQLDAGLVAQLEPAFRSWASALPD
ncbi:MAG TPA: hypothetical protein VFZ61_31040 [Polyangiales bacterium]